MKNSPKLPQAPVRVLAPRDLPSKGINYSKSYLRKLWTNGDFPPPTRLTPYKIVWSEEAIDKWLADKLGAES